MTLTSVEKLEILEHLKQQIQSEKGSGGASNDQLKVLEEENRALKVELELERQRAELQTEEDENSSLLAQIRILKASLTSTASDDEAKAELTEVKLKMASLEKELAIEKKLTDSLQHEIQEVKMKNKMLAQQKSEIVQAPTPVQHQVQEQHLPSQIQSPIPSSQESVKQLEQFRNNLKSQQRESIAGDNNRLSAYNRKRLE